MSRRPENGFTLIELMVALAVFSIAALALLRLNGYALTTTADLDARSMAGIVVRNAAVLAATNRGAITRGTSTSNVVNGGRSFVVQQRVSPTDDRRLLQVDLIAVEPASGARATATVIKRVG